MIGAFLPKLIPLLQQVEAKARQALVQQAMQPPPGAPAGPTAPPPMMPQPVMAHPAMHGQFLPPQPPQMPPGGMPVVPH